ncbi:MAG: hypothetical protein RLT05_09755, partial [Bauldia litoralis]
ESRSGEIFVKPSRSGGKAAQDILEDAAVVEVFELLGVRAVIAESFERIHRSNLIGMGVLPLVFQDGQSWKSLGLDGSETVTISGISEGLKPRQTLEAEITFADGTVKLVPLLCRIDTLDELEYFNNGGILQYVLRRLAA